MHSVVTEVGGGADGQWLGPFGLMARAVPKASPSGHRRPCQRCCGRVRFPKPKVYFGGSVDGVVIDEGPQPPDTIRR